MVLKQPDVIIGLYVLVIAVWLWLAAFNPFRWKSFSTGAKYKPFGRRVMDRLEMDPQWEAALAHISLLSGNLAQSVETGAALNLRSRRAASTMLGEIARDLEDGQLMIQRYSGFMWSKIAGNFSVYFANERSKKPVNAETVRRMNYWFTHYRNGVLRKDIRNCHAAVANLVFITETGEATSTHQRTPDAKRLKLYHEFKDDARDLVSGDARNVHGKTLDQILDKWAPLAISHQDPYLYLLLVYLSTYRRSFNILYNYAIASHDEYILLDYKIKMNRIQHLISIYVKALTKGDLRTQYKCCLDFATLAQIATGKDKHLINEDYILAPAPSENTKDSPRRRKAHIL